MLMLDFEQYAPGKLIRNFAIRAEVPSAQRRVKAVREGPSTPDKPGVIRGISPFDVPEGVQAELESDGRCVFRFVYVNNEPAQAKPLALDGSGTLRALLGQHTSKILELQVDNAAERLSAGAIQFDQAVFEKVATTLPVSARKACLRNAIIVQAIMESMPASFRREIIAGFKTVAVSAP